ncbi:ABC transporter permease [Rothia sp. ZJ932]|uniref:ABC transporter permease n=1 Tax=Rothia sp. ZJ932 TaxID=2810516 RepID=UPI00196737F8|nr:ABC transporter permease [Rothia sp. ZJ932]QRZ61593.1 ABC transporter permease [Rothia sp. ZJ932]
MKTTVYYAFLSVIRRYKRNLLTIGAMLVGAASVVALIGISESSALHSATRLTKYESAHIGVRLQPDTWQISEEEIQNRINQVPSVETGGTLTISEQPILNVSTLRRTTHKSVTLAIVSQEGLHAREATITEGAYYRPHHATEPTVMLGSALAQDLGVTTRPGSNRLLINNQAVSVAAIIKDGPDKAALAVAVMVSPDSALFPEIFTSARALVIKVAPGGAETAGADLKRVLDPSRPDDVNIAIPPSPQQLKRQLTEDSRLLTAVILGVMVVSTSFGIMMTMYMSVWERRREIGINRALGAARRSVAMLFLIEAIIVGALGALSGFVVGICIAFTVAHVNGWDFSIPAYTAALPLLGALVGALSGALPAYKASTVEPLELLQ